MSNIVRYGESELKCIGRGADTKDPMNKLMHDNIIEIVKKFSRQGHSGFSANYAIGILEKLLRWEPLSPLTGNDEEWQEVGSGMWQNRRCSRVFKDQEGRAYDIEGKVFVGKDGVAYTNGDSSVDITFPYTPKTEYVEVP